MAAWGVRGRAQAYWACWGTHGLLLNSLSVLDMCLIVWAWVRAGRPSLRSAIGPTHRYTSALGATDSLDSLDSRRIAQDRAGSVSNCRPRRQFPRIKCARHALIARGVAPARRLRWPTLRLRTLRALSLPAKCEMRRFRHDDGRRLMTGALAFGPELRPDPALTRSPLLLLRIVPTQDSTGHPGSMCDATGRRPPPLDSAHSTLH